METNRQNCLQNVFKVICVSGVLATTVWCFYEFAKNEDTTEVKFKRFLEDEDSIYPDISIMIPHQLNDRKIRKILGNDFNTSMYRRYLFGAYFS